MAGVTGRPFTALVVNTLKRLVVGRPLRSDRLGEQLLQKRIALPVFASDPLSSVAYATQEILLVLTLGSSLLTQPWLLLALTIYATNLAIAFFVQRPNLRRLVGVKAAADDRVWQERAKRQRYVSYATAALVGTIGFLMSTKPQLW